ncbi:ferritin [Thermosipho melanesiensis]|uniref:Ferritin n=2 Tax=Thermosipho melanesiensis TaxID=46541 RepID=A6LMA2_THEM4|nr:ferritin [Thermosipho melanesiensis]ABR31053.1 Ferroxidase [Thermosipho melanesiensis BI429]APT74147.1 ferritin [Thermosipho melanesiensis]OOC36093.1 ferritin [Thermosipho melanesiensis]OOC36910.1 ferritin [Thermosipho melanesiensis]OOC37661.1 ferritin [Thermosipho melanesiensis]
MLNEKMIEALNNQVNEEFYSAYLYLSMAAHFENIGLKGFANWMRIQAMEEKDHAMKIFDYLARQGAKIKLFGIKEPPSEFGSIKEIFEEVLKHEQYITSKINELVDLAESLKDRPTFNFLQWYVDEQVEEEENANDILSQLKLIGDNKNALFMLDKELSQRTYAPLSGE